MKYHVFLLLSLLSVTLAPAQSIYSLYDDGKMADSLKTEIQHAKTDSLKAMLHFKLANIYWKDHKEQLYSDHLEAGQKLARKNAFLKDVSYYFKATKYMFGKDRSAYQKALEEADRHLLKYNIREIYGMRSLIYHSQYINLTMMDKAEKGFAVLLEKAIPMAMKANDSEMLGILYKSVAVTFYNDEKYEKAEFYISECIKNVEKKVVRSSTYSESLIESYLLYAEILITQNKFQKVDGLLASALKKLKAHPDSNLYPSYYYTKGLLEHTKKNYTKALANYNEGIKIAEQLKDEFAALRIKLIKYDTLKELKRYEQARDLLEESIQSEKIHILDKKNYIKELSWIYKQLHNLPKSLYYIERYTKMSDSLNNEAYECGIAALESKYKAAENEKKIHMLEVQKQRITLNNEKIKWYHLFLIVLATLLLFIMGLLWIGYRNKSKLANQREINYVQNINSLKSQKKLEVMQAMIEGQEKERTRVARDLHDGIGSRLSSLKMQMAQRMDGAEEFKNLTDLLTVSITELRQVAFNLVPEVLLKMGLEDALKDLCYSMSTEKVKIYCHITEIDPSLKSNLQITIFRIVQELLNNALKHSGCTEIILDCSQNKNLFLISVEDNGKGFEYCEGKPSGLGINNIRNRIELLHGKMEIQSAPNAGTVFNIELLIRNDDSDETV